jgi:hypothetical protein
MKWRPAEFGVQVLPNFYGQSRTATEGYGQFVFLHRPGKDAFHRVPSRTSACSLSSQQLIPSKFDQIRVNSTKFE